MATGRTKEKGSAMSMRVSEDFKQILSDMTKNRHMETVTGYLFMLVMKDLEEYEIEQAIKKERMGER